MSQTTVRPTRTAKISPGIDELRRIAEEGASRGLRRIPIYQELPMLILALMVWVLGLDFKLIPRQ